MKFPKFSYHVIFPLIAIFMFSFVFSITAQQFDNNQLCSPFKNAQITMDQKGRAAIEIRFQQDSYVPVNQFFENYRLAFGLSKENEARSFQKFTDKIGETHHRVKQYYKGIELTEVQYLLHVKDGLIFHAHGNFVPGLDFDVTPVLSEPEALERALNYIGAETYMWQNPKNEVFLKNEQNDPKATFFPKSELKISAGRKEKIAENFRLVYRFNIISERPLGSYLVDVDAMTGAIAQTLSLINFGDVQGSGLSLYNGMVPITVSDENYPSSPPYITHWHLSDWNAFGGSGECWWLADPMLGDQGGYADLWYEVLETDSIFINGSNLKLTFYHRYFVEPPQQWWSFDGNDGMNVQISSDGGKSWQVLMNPSPDYTCERLWGFGGYLGVGDSIPGWAGKADEWAHVSFDLNEFSDQYIKLRFVFASDGGYSSAYGGPEFFGWQIDNIEITSSMGTLFQNTGNNDNVMAMNLWHEVTNVAGKYRLREMKRGGGIRTYNSQGSYAFWPSIDFVDADTLFMDNVDRSGVSVHWALETTFDYYLTRHGRKSYDDMNGKLIAYTNQVFIFSEESYSPNNAMWIGMVNADFGNFTCYGIGDGDYYGPWTALDIVAHEITHGVTQFSANLNYFNESGALNESFSDIFGMAVEFFKEGIHGDWLMGEDHVKSGNIVRSLIDPKQRQNPDTYLGEYWMTAVSEPNLENDFGGVHCNCGVQNHWFYLLCEGGSGVNDNGDDYSVSGIGIEDAEQIAYRNLTVYLQPTSQYIDAAKYSVQSAIDLFGETSPQKQAVIDAWYAAGIYLEPRAVFSQDSFIFVTSLGKKDSLALSIRNEGLDTLKISNIEIDDARFYFTDSLSFPVCVACQKKIDFGISFYYPYSDDVNGHLKIYCNDPRNEIKSIPLRGVVLHNAIAGTIYAGTSALSNGVLLSLNPNSGKGSIIGSTGFGQITGLAVHPVAQELYGTVPVGNTTKIVRLDGRTGAAFELITLPVLNMRAITFDQDTLYGANWNLGRLYKIDLTTQKGQLIGGTNLPLLSGIAMSPAGQLWAVKSNSDEVYKINKLTAAATLVGRTGISPTSEIEFDASGNLYGISGFLPENGFSLIQIDTTTAIGTDIGPIGFDEVYGLAITGSVFTDIGNRAASSLPTQYQLHQNYPNPFNPTTVIQYSLPKASHVQVEIFDVLGRKLRTLLDARKPAGHFQITWDGRNAQNKHVAAGVYFCRLTAGDFVKMIKLTLVK